MLIVALGFIKHIKIIAIPSELSESDFLKNKVPKLQDLMEYGAFLQAADIVGFLCDKSTNENDTELIVAKHRGGDLFTIRYKYDSELKKYIEI